MDRMREETINNYIFTVQVIFSLMTLIIIFKYFGFESYNMVQAFVVTFLIIVFLLSIGYFSVHLGRQNYRLDFAIIILDFLMITFLFLNTGYFELRFLYLIPIIISAIKFNLRTSLTVSAIAGLANLLIDLIYINKLPLGYSIETDLMFLVIYILIGWLIGNFVKIESNIRINLYRTQEKLIEQSSLLGKLINEMPLCIAVINKEERIVHINQAALDYARLKNDFPEDYVGRPYEEFMDKVFNNYNYQELLILDSLHTGKAYFKEKIIRDSKLLEVIAHPIYDLEGSHIIYAMAIFYDVTSEEFINEKIRNLERLNLVGQMGASIAHEIKNPLTTIRGFLQLAQKSDEKLTSGQLDLLISEIDRCNSIIADFLSISKKSSRAKTKCDLKQVLERQLILIERDATLAKVNLRVKMDDVRLLVDENEIKQLFLNLTHNAIEAMPSGGNLYITLENQQDDVLLEIKDNGKGIPKEIMDKIGTPFITTKQNGTGLGLSVCYRIVEGHGAKLNITGNKSGGTTVTVVFPKELGD
ncbi:MAG: ATP-binding protein [Peptococcaceae bacterium]